MDRFIGNMLRLCSDDSDRRTNFENFLIKEVAIRRAATKLHVAILSGQVASMQNRSYTRQRLGLGGIDALDFRMRMRAAERSCEQHAVLPHVFRIVAEVGHNAEAVEARNARSDDIKPLRLGSRLGGCTGRRSLRSGLGPRCTLAKLRSIASQDGGRHLMEFTDKLIPQRIVSESAPLIVGQAGRVLRILNDAKGINL